MGIAMGMKDAGAGFIEMTSDWNTPDPATEFAMVRRIMEASGRPLVFSLKQRHDRTEAWKDLLALSTQAAADGLPIRCVSPPRPIGALLGLSGSPESVRRHADLSLDRASAAGPARRRDARSGGSGEDPADDPAGVQHLVAAEPDQLQADVPLHQSAELHAVEARIRSPRSPRAKAARRRKSPTTC